MLVLSFLSLSSLTTHHCITIRVAESPNSGPSIQTLSTSAVETSGVREEGERESVSAGPAEGQTLLLMRLPTRATVKHVFDFAATLGDVRQFIRDSPEYIALGAKGDFGLEEDVFPRRPLPRAGAATLASLGLVPRARLHVVLDEPLRGDDDHSDGKISRWHLPSYPFFEARNGTSPQVFVAVLA